MWKRLALYGYRRCCLARQSSAQVQLLVSSGEHPVVAACRSVWTAATHRLQAAEDRRVTGSHQEAGRRITVVKGACDCRLSLLDKEKPGPGPGRGIPHVSRANFRNHIRTDEHEEPHVRSRTRRSLQYGQRYLLLIPLARDEPASSRDQ